MTHKISYRQATLSDAENIAHVYLTSRKTLLSYAPLVHSDADILDWIKNTLIPIKHVTVVENNSDIIGMMALSNDGTVGWIEQLYLLPEWVGFGIGRQLITMAKKALGSPIRLKTFQENSQARNFYEQQDFSVVFLSDGSTNEEHCPDILYEWKDNVLTTVDDINSSDQSSDNDFIELENYDPTWPDKASKEIEKIKAACPFDWVLNIQHFGSTAIIGLKAKPIIDLMIAVTNIAEAKKLVPILESMGYLFWEENPKKDRLFFVKGMPPFGEKRTHHVHVFEITHPEWSARQIFRDYLNKNETAKNTYLDLKLALAKQFKHDREAYTAGKTEFVNTIVKKATREK